MAEPLRVLFVDDCDDDVQLMSRELGRGGWAVDGRRVESRDGLEAALGEDSWDVAIVDYVIPGYGGRSALATLARERPDVPAILVSGKVAEEVALAAMELGAGDVVLKNDLARLVPAVQRELREAAGRRARAAAETALRDSRLQLDVRNRVAEAFLNFPGEQMYERVLAIVLEAMGCRYGVFAYLDEEGALVCPSFQGKTWEQCHVPGKAMRLPRESWGEDVIWARVARERRPLYTNLVGRLPEGHIPVRNVLCAPMMHEDRVIGHFLVGERERDLDDDDARALEDICAYVAPVLQSRLAREAEERARREAETAVQTSEELYRSFVENFQGVAFRSDLDLTPHFFHGAVEAITGYSEAELLAGTPPFLELVHPDDRAAKLGDSGRVNSEPGYAHEQDYRIVRRDGEVRWVHEYLQNVCGADGRVAYVQGALYDVTDRRLAQDALLLSEQRHRTLFEKSPMGVYLFDAAGVITECNERFAEMVGTTCERLIGFDNLAVTDRRIVPMIEAALAGRMGEYEGPYVTTLTGREMWLVARASPLYDAGGGVVGGMGVELDVIESKRAEERLSYLALHDALTDLPNEALFRDRLRQALSRADRGGENVAVAHLDIDHFRTVNETLGRDTGDRLLQEVARRLNAIVREGDSVARAGGNAFLVLFPAVHRAEDVVLVAEKLMAVFAEPWHHEGQDYFFSASVGMTVFPADGDDIETLLRNADSAKRRAKEQGRGRYQFYDPTMGTQAAERLTMVSELHRALERGEFELAYQPLVTIGDGSIVGVEALLRWRHPDRGVIPPLDFIPAAEESGLIVPIGEWVLREACGRVAAWGARLRRPLRASVNLSTRQFQQADLVATVVAVLEDTGLAADLLELEITETLAMSDVDYTAQVVRDLRERGVRIALDDYGTGYSSLSHLAALQISTLKIDRSFVTDLLEAPDHAAIAGSVIALGQRLGLTVVAEGVETTGQLAYLGEHQCDIAQGFLLSRPLPPDECGELLSRPIRWA